MHWVVKWMLKNIDSNKIDLEDAYSIEKIASNCYGDYMRYSNKDNLSDPQKTVSTDRLNIFNTHSNKFKTED